MNVTAAKTAGKARSLSNKYNYFLDDFADDNIPGPSNLINQMHLASVLPAGVVSVFNKENQ